MGKSEGFDWKLVQIVLSPLMSDARSGFDQNEQKMNKDTFLPVFKKEKFLKKKKNRERHEISSLLDVSTNGLWGGRPLPFYCILRLCGCKFN
jgi:hypothetical protein